MPSFFQELWINLQNTSFLEYIAVISGIASVWFSKKENILVYPVGLVNTIIYVYLSFKYHLIGESVVNFYYTVVSIYGWWIWAKKDSRQEYVLHISFSSRKELINQALFFLLLYIVFFSVLSFLK